MTLRFLLRPVIAAPLCWSGALGAQDALAPRPSASASAASPDPGADAELPPAFPDLGPPRAAPADVPTPRASPTRAASPPPRATPTARPAARPRRARAGKIETVVLPPRPGRRALWPWLLGIGAMLSAVLGWALWRRPEDEWLAEEVATDPPEPVPVPLPPEPVAQLAWSLRATRAGLNLISATAECELTVSNTGDAPATDIRAVLRLMSAPGDQDASAADASARPVVPAFGLAPGEERRIRCVAALVRDEIAAVDAGGRSMFVPMLALTVRYRDGGQARADGQLFALGIERAGSAKLAPMGLDGPPRTYDRVAARPDGPIRRG